MLQNVFLYLFYLSTSLISHPNSTTVCKTSEFCSIDWDDSLDTHAHLEVQVKNKNNSWVSTTSNDKSFLSVIVDENSNSYNWFVPQYLGQYWRNPKRVVLEELASGNQYYSADFTVPGISLEMETSSLQLDSQKRIPISWSTNDNSKFGMYLLQNDNIIEVIQNESLPPNSSIEWLVPYIPNQDLQIMIRSEDLKTYAITDVFQIAVTTTPTTTLTSTPTSTATTTDTTTTTPTSTQTSTPTSTQTTTITTNTTLIPTEKTRDINIIWYILVPIFIILGIMLLYLIYTLIVIFYCSSNKVNPQPEPRSFIRSENNPVYDGGRRPLPPISSPQNFRVVSSFGDNIYEEVPHHKNVNEYNKLNRNRLIKNDVYI